MHMCTHTHMKHVLLTHSSPLSSHSLLAQGTSYLPSCHCFCERHDADKKVKKATRNKNIKVSPAWMAPELLHGGEITPKADVFSFGIILWEMMSGKHPYEGCTVFQVEDLDI